MRIFLLTFLGLIWSFCFSNAFSIDYDRKEKRYTIPIRELSVIADKRGYYPDNIVLFAGEKAHMFLTSAEDNISCFSLPEKQVFVSLRKGDIVEKQVYFEKPGTYNFYCPTNKIKGTITVLEHPSDKKKRLRKIASEKAKSRIWFPREE